MLQIHTHHDNNVEYHKVDSRPAWHDRSITFLYNKAKSTFFILVFWYVIYLF